MVSQESRKKRERLERLTVKPGGRAAYNPRYSVLIRWLRLLLPLFAVAIIAVVFSWGFFTEEDLSDIALQKPPSVQTIGKNELLNPRFESKDDSDQPYTITAKRAIQGDENVQLVILEEPLADILLSSGNWVAISAQQGAYRQDTQRLLLKGHVTIFHDTGYQLMTPELHIDPEAHMAWSEYNVKAQGPAGTLDAQGVQAHSKNGKLAFTGPAKMVLVNGLKGFDLKPEPPVTGALP